MFPTYAGVKTQLTADDRSAIQALYGAPSVATKPSGATSKPATTATYRPTGKPLQNVYNQFNSLKKLIFLQQALTMVFRIFVKIFILTLLSVPKDTIAIS